MHPQTIIFLGPQGCGKGTQLKLLAEHLSKTDPSREILTAAMGSLVRAMAKEEGYTASLLRPVIEQGGLVEYAVTISLLGNYLVEHLNNNEHLLIEGFPRSIEQVTFLDSAMRFYKRERPVVVRIEISDEEALKRLLSRGRADDIPEAIRNRLAWTRHAEKEIEEWFRSSGRYEFVEIDGQHSIEETQAAIRGALKLI